MGYLDNAATTPLCKVARETMINHLSIYGNPSSSYEIGHTSLMLIEDARATIAKCINAEPNEIYFTSGGSEANTWAIKGTDCQNIFCSAIEHHSILNAINHKSRIRCDRNGIVNMNDIRAIADFAYEEIYNGRTLISVMTVNNEIGTIQPIKKIAQIVHENGCLFHTDAVQAVGHIPIDVKDIDCDLLSASAHKFGGPKGVGFLYIKNGIKINPLICGGKQESGLRGGTENILGIIGMAAALKCSVAGMVYNGDYIVALRDKLLNNLLEINGVTLNGTEYPAYRVSSNINISIEGVSGQDIVELANEYGIYISAGSACNEGNATPSHVLKAIGLSDAEALSSIRITLGHENTLEEVEYASRMLHKIITRLREVKS